MTTIKQEDFIQSIADAYQFISYYHPVDFIKAMAEAYEREQSPAAKNAIAQILINARMAAEGHRPICQDTGIAVVYLKVGMNVRWDAKLSVTDMVSEGVRRAYTNKENPLRGSIVADPDGTRKNTRDNSPAVVHMELVPGDKVEVKLAAKGGGSESKTKFAVLNPSDSVVDWVLEQVPTMGGDWCPPGMLGVGIGGTPEKAMVLAKESILDHLSMHELKARGPKNRAEELRLELFEKINALGIGAQGLGGLTTLLDVKVLDYPTHAVMKPVAIVPNLLTVWQVVQIALVERDKRAKLAGILFGLLTCKPHLGLVLPMVLLALGAWRTIAAAAATRRGVRSTTSGHTTPSDLRWPTISSSGCSRCLSRAGSIPMRRC